MTSLGEGRFRRTTVYLNVYWRYQGSSVKIKKLWRREVKKVTGVSLHTREVANVQEWVDEAANSLNERLSVKKLNLWWGPYTVGHFLFNRARDIRCCHKTQTSWLLRVLSHELVIQQRGWALVSSPSAGPHVPTLQGINYFWLIFDKFYSGFCSSLVLSSWMTSASVNARNRDC